MKFKFFYVPNTPVTLRALVSVSIPIDEARRMLGKIFEIQYVNSLAEPAVRNGVPWDSYAPEGASVENYSEHGVTCWSVPLDAIELRRSRS